MEIYFGLKVKYKEIDSGSVQRTDVELRFIFLNVCVVCSCIHVQWTFRDFTGLQYKLTQLLVLSSSLHHDTHKFLFYFFIFLYYAPWLPTVCLAKPTSV